MNIPGMETETRLNNKDVLKSDLSDSELLKAREHLEKVIEFLAESETK